MSGAFAVKLDPDGPASYARGDGLQMTQDEPVIAGLDEETVNGLVESGPFDGPYQEDDAELESADGDPIEIDNLSDPEQLDELQERMDEREREKDTPAPVPGSGPGTIDTSPRMPDADWLAPGGEVVRRLLDETTRVEYADVRHGNRDPDGTIKVTMKRKGKEATIKIRDGAMVARGRPPATVRPIPKRVRRESRRYGREKVRCPSNALGAFTPVDKSHPVTAF